MAYQPRFTIEVHHVPSGFFASCGPDNDGEDLLSNIHAMPGGALRQLGWRLDQFVERQAEVQSDRRVSA